MISRIPLRWRLALWSFLVTAAALTVFAIFTSINLYVSLIEEEDEEVGIAACNLLKNYEESLQSGRPFAPSAMDSWINFAIFDSEGSIVHKTPSLDEALARKALGDGGPASREHKGQLWRMNTHRSARGSIASCYELGTIRSDIRRLLSSFVFSIPLVGGLVTLGSFYLSRGTLAPLRSLADLAQTMHAGGLHQRVPLPVANDELRRLAEVLNDLFARLEKSFEQAGRFSADASHELRTPLTVLRGQIESLIRKADDAHAVETGLLVIQEEIARLERTSEHLLQLSRFDAGNRPQLQERLDLSQLVREACEDAEMLAASRKVQLTAKVADGAIIRGNPDLLRQLLLNLLENAARYNQDEGSIECTLTCSGQKASICVANTGPGIDPIHHGQLFTRFYRCDPSRSDRGGQGLGLSLSREIARAHGGDLVLSSPGRSGWTEFTATFPLQ